MQDTKDEKIASLIAVNTTMKTCVGDRSFLIASTTIGWKTNNVCYELLTYMIHFKLPASDKPCLKYLVFSRVPSSVKPKLLQLLGHFKCQKEEVNESYIVITFLFILIVNHFWQ